MERVSALSRVEVELDRVSRRRDVLGQWSRAFPELARAGLRSLRELPPWVWGLDPGEAEITLRVLVELAQAGDDCALLAVLACLRPGACAVSKRTGVPVDEVVSELAIVVLEFPVARRNSLVGSLLLDTRKRLARCRRREGGRDVPAGDTRLALRHIESEGELGLKVSAAERLAELVLAAWRAGHLSDDQARIIWETRVVGEPVTAAAARRGVTRKAIFQRRQRAEALLAEVLR